MECSQYMSEFFLEVSLTLSLTIMITFLRGQSQTTPRRTNGEIPCEYFPNFPLLFERPKYGADNDSNDDDQFWEDLCSKLFPEHVKLSPGLFLVTCACQNKKIMVSR